MKPDEWPFLQFRLGDEAAGLHRIQYENIQPGYVVGDDQQVARQAVRRQPAHARFDTHHLQELGTPALDQRPALRQIDQRKHECGRGDALEDVRAHANIAIQAQGQRRTCAATRLAPSRVPSIGGPALFIARTGRRGTCDCPRAPPKRAPELLGVERREPIAIDDMILPAARRDLDRAQDRRQPACSLPIPAMRDAVEQSGPVRVAATGWIDERLGLHAWHVEHEAIGVDARSVATQRDDQRIDSCGDVRQRQARFARSAAAPRSR